MSAGRVLLAAAALAVLVGAAVVVFAFDPSVVRWYPRCPLYAWTGLKCAGCGTLRAFHAALHLRFAEAVRLNPYAVALLPFLAAISIFPGLQRKFPKAGWVVFWSAIVWTVVRNLPCVAL